MKMSFDKIVTNIMHITFNLLYYLIGVGISFEFKLSPREPKASAQNWMQYLNDHY